MSTLIDDELYQGYLTKVYQHTHVKNYSPSEREAFTQENVSITYGELLYPSVKKMLKQIALRSDDVFLDLGSGIGKCALQVFMQSDVHKVVGIEASNLLHEQALKICQQVKTDFPFFWFDDRQLNFIGDNFLKANWQQATVVYTCSTCFTQELLVAIGNKINQQATVKQVLSLRPLPTLKMPLKKVFSVECSWDSALCFVYGLG